MFIWLGENIVIDESIACFKERLIYKKYCKNKKKKWSVKFWVLVDCETAYVYNIKMYTGRKRKNKSKINLAYDVVSKLLRGLEKKGPFIY